MSEMPVPSCQSDCRSCKTVHELFREPFCEELAHEMAQTHVIGESFVVLSGRNFKGERKIFFGASYENPLPVEGCYLAPNIVSRAEMEDYESRSIQALDDYKAHMQSIADESDKIDVEASKLYFTEKIETLKLLLSENKRLRKIQRENLALGQNYESEKRKLDEASLEDGKRLRRLKAEGRNLVSEKNSAIQKHRVQISHLRKERGEIARGLQKTLFENFLSRTLLNESRLPEKKIDQVGLNVLIAAARRGIIIEACAGFVIEVQSDGSRRPVFQTWELPQKDESTGALLCSLLDLEKRKPWLPPLEILHRDKHFVVVNKPSGLLAVPGRRLAQQDSVTARVALHFPEATGPLAVHRLDQATSGLMIVALNPEAHRELSILFQRKLVEKKYLAEVCGVVAEDEGTISLPLRGDFSRRPHQMVDHKAGKPSITKYQVLSRGTESTNLELIPITGRTHQLRVHCADSEGLACAIKGDRLYGAAIADEALHLHASYIRFRNPFVSEFVECHSEPLF